MGLRVAAIVLGVVLTVEAILVLVATVATAGQFFAHGAKVQVDGLAFVICLVIGFLWVAAAAIGVWLGAKWARGLVISWQLIQLVVGVGALEGLLAGPSAGLVLLILGILGIVLVLMPGTTRALARTHAAD